MTQNFLKLKSERPKSLAAIPFHVYRYSTSSNLSKPLQTIWKDFSRNQLVVYPRKALKAPLIEWKADSTTFLWENQQKTFSLSVRRSLID